MQQFRFYQPIQIRYNDIDAQGHVNNAKYITFIEFARIKYIVEIGLWAGESFLDLDLIVADSHVSYLAPTKLSQSIKVGVRVSAIGNKSLTFQYQIEDEDSRKVLATAETVMVSFDYRTERTTPVSQDWRKMISKYEGVDFD
ncbi:MAG: acyl-CoA thioesterase [Anaerolineaceae bacterium]|nr:acyl-CoA thioesterase [Anaerolineaceae bacterium]MBN2677390.1 acyl-CoA thioesterase [Anaerolineaceae bacterium]